VSGKWTKYSYPVGDFFMLLDLKAQQVTALELSSDPIWLEGTYSNGHHTNCNETSNANGPHMAQFDKLDMTTLEATVETCILGAVSSSSFAARSIAPKAAALIDMDVIISRNVGSAGPATATTKFCPHPRHDVPHQP
jgi:hypothetical protein